MTVMGKFYIEGTRAEDKGGVRVRNIAREVTKQQAEAKAAQAATEDAQEAREAKEAAERERLRLLRDALVAVKEQRQALEKERGENLHRRGRLRVGLLEEVPEDEAEVVLQNLRERAVVIARDLEELTVGEQELHREIASIQGASGAVRVVRPGK